jgi:hypothetical protein
MSDGLSVPTILPMRLTSPMLIRRADGGGSWHAPQTTAYTNEAELRDLVAETPSLLPGVDEGPAAAAKEMPISGAGSADVVIVDAAGDITVVECKLRANPEIRRQVVGQLLAYASAIWQMSFADFDDAFRRSEARRSLSDALVGGDDLDEEEFSRAVEANLMSGSMRLIIAVDEITDELRRIVSYLNSHTTTNVEFLALEMRRAADEGVEVLLPEIYGEESARTKRARTPRGERLDRETLLASIREQSELAADAADALFDWADREPRLNVRYTRTRGRIETAGRLLLRFAATGWPGKINVALQTLADHGEPWDDERIEQFVQELADIGVNLNPDERAPTAPLEPLADDVTRRRFLALMEQALDTLTASP